MASEEFKPGDLVRIKCRIEMPLFMKYAFVSEMEEWSGKEFVIYDVYNGRVMFENMSIQMKRWLWCTDMIELVCPPVTIEEQEIYDLMNI